MKKRLNPRQAIVLNILNRLSANVQADLLADGTLSTRYDIPIHRRQHLSNGVVLKQETLFKAFETALRGEPIPPILTEKNAPLDAKISIDTNGAGLVDLGSTGFRFDHIDLLSDDPERRIQALNRYLEHRTLAKRETTLLRTLVQRTDFSHDDFLRALTALNTSIESFGSQLRTRLEAGQISAADLLPDDERHWEQLIAPLGKSQTLSAFIEDELYEARIELLSQQPLKAISSISLSFSAPALVPLTMFRQLDTDLVVSMLEHLLDYDDYFAHVGAFELCADSIERDQRFVSLGERFLDRLFGDHSRLQAACELFATAFVIAASQLSRHERLRGRRAFWQRLAATTHASLILRVAGVADDTDYSEFLSWALRNSGRPYTVSTLLAMRDEPTWRPDWIMPDFLVADAFGRANVACSRLREDLVPSNWTARIDSARAILNERNLIVLTVLPAVNEGARRPKQPGLPEVETVAEMFNALSSDPSPKNLVLLAYVIFAIGFPEGYLGSLGKVLRHIRSVPASLSDPTSQTALTLCCHIAAQTNNVALAQDLTKTCIDGVRFLKEAGDTNQVTLRIIEAAAADPNPEVAFSTLAQRLEHLSAILPARLMPEFLDVLEMLRDIEPRLAVLLGRAVALAQLGMPRAEVN